MSTTENKLTENTIIESFKITGDWAVQAKKLKENFPQLTDEDLTFESEKENEMLTKVETKLNKNRDEVIAIIKNFEEKSL